MEYMTWLERTKKFEEKGIYANDVITCDVMREFKITDTDKLYNKECTKSTYEILADYINDWLCCTTTEADLAYTVLDSLIAGIVNDNEFTIDDVAQNNNCVRDYINSRI